MSPALEASEYGRPIVYLARASWYNDQVTITNLLSTRDVAIAWARAQIIGVPEAPSGTYPDEWPRDDVRLRLTWRVRWSGPERGNGWVTVERFEVETT